MSEKLSTKKHGGRNLTLLGFGAVTIALATTIISLIIYHNSGDIYLDRSRPGFLPDEAEAANENKTDYTFSDSGPINNEVIKEYIKEYQKDLNTLNKLSEPYNAESLSDESLGIPPAEIIEL